MRNCKCSKCGELKEFSAFYKRKGRPIGRTSHCRVCIIAARPFYDPALRRANPEPYRARDRKFRAANLEKVRAKDRRAKAVWRKANPEVEKARTKAWQKANPHYSCAYVGRRRAAKLKATPVWANDFFIEEAYELAQRRSRLTGIKWEVDHIVPLKSRLVCGLHAYTNIRVIPKDVNRAKGNRYWPDMPRD